MLRLQPNEKQVTSVLPRWKAGYQQLARNNTKWSRDITVQPIAYAVMTSINISMVTNELPYRFIWLDNRPADKTWTTNLHRWRTRVNYSTAPFVRLFLLHWSFRRCQVRRGGVLRWCSRSGLHALSPMVNGMTDLPHPWLTLGQPPSPSKSDSHLNVVKGWQIRKYLTNVSGNTVNKN